MIGLHWHIDCASGAAGDMLLAAMLDLGASRQAVEEALVALGLASTYLVVQRCVRGGIAANDVTVRTDLGVPPGLHDHDHGHDHGHDHDHDHHDHDHHDHDHLHDHDHTHPPHHGHDHGHEHPHDHGHDLPPTRASKLAHDASPADVAHGHDHYHYGRIRAHIAAAPLRAEVQTLALQIFDRLARAEATLHGTTVEAVRFHEVGAIDSIVDVVGCAAAFCSLAPSSVSCSAVAMGSGTLRCAHGVLPVPAPAALAIMTEAAGLIYGGGIARELCTPTGAAVLAAIVGSWGEMPTGIARAVGWGAGDAELADRANVVRITAMQPGAVIVAGAQQPPDVWQIEANIDDLNPQLCDVATASMFAAGALDVWWAPITMKKGRPALQCGALTPRACRDAVVNALLVETTTIGVRYFAVERTVLRRRFEVVATAYGDVTVKVSSLAGQDLTATPEYTDCVRLAQAAGVTVRMVIAAAQAAWHERRHA